MSKRYTAVCIGAFFLFFLCFIFITFSLIFSLTDKATGYGDELFTKQFGSDYTTTLKQL